MSLAAPGAGAVLGATFGQTAMARLLAARADGGEPLCVELLHPELAGDAALAALPGAVHAAAAVRHPAVVATIGEIHPAGWHGAVTEAVSGSRLVDIVPRGDGLTAAAALAVAEGLLGALEAVHSAGLAHGAVSPEAVWVTAAGLVRLDGLALALAVAGERPAGVPGDYLSPERRAGGPASAAADVWAAAALTHTLLTGRPPGGDGSLAVQLGGRLTETLAAALTADAAARPRAAELRGGLMGIAMTEVGPGWRRDADLAGLGGVRAVDWTVPAGDVPTTGMTLAPPPAPPLDLDAEAPPAAEEPAAEVDAPPPDVAAIATAPVATAAGADAEGPAGPAAPAAAPPAPPPPAAPPRRRRRRAVVWTLVLVVVVAAAGAGGGAALVLLGGRTSTPAAPGPLHVGNDVKLTVSGPDSQGVCDNVYHITATGSLTGKGTLISHFEHDNRPSGDIVSPVDGNPGFALTTDVRVEGRQQGTDSVTFVITSPVQRQVSQTFSITCPR